jgi:hypothetical protein
MLFAGQLRDRHGGRADAGAAFDAFAFVERRRLGEAISSA